MELIKPLELQGILVNRSREKLEMEIDDYIVIERNGLIIGCTVFHVMPEQTRAKIACLAVHADYRKGTRGNSLLDYLSGKAEKQASSDCSCAPLKPRTGSRIAVSSPTASTICRSR